MHSMQEDAAGDLASDALVAAHVEKLPQPADAEVLGEVPAMEAKAVQQVREGLLARAAIHCAVNDRASSRQESRHDDRVLCKFV